MSTRVVFCSRCGKRLREPVAAPKMALKRKAATAKAGAATTAPEMSHDPSPEVRGSAPAVLEYRSPPPPAKPRKQAAPQRGKARGGWALVVLVAIAVKAWVASERWGNQPPVVAPPRLPPAYVPPRINLNPQMGPGAMPVSPSRYPDARGRGPHADDFNRRPIPGTPYSVDSRGRLVDSGTGAPVNSRAPAPPAPHQP
jgi:hypothetical protein